MTNLNLRVPAGNAAEASPLVEQLARKADANHDGTVTSAEFTAFLSNLMKSLDADDRAGGNGEAKAPAAEPAAPPPALRGVQPTSPALAIEALRRAIAQSGGK